MYNGVKKIFQEIIIKIWVHIEQNSIECKHKIIQDGLTSR